MCRSSASTLCGEMAGTAVCICMNAIFIAAKKTNSRIRRRSKESGPLACQAIAAAMPQISAANAQQSAIGLVGESSRRSSVISR